MQTDERRIAVFIDFENVAMGVRESNYGSFDIDLVLKRLVEKGKIMVKRAYSDWHRYSEFKRAFHQAAIELIDVPQTRYGGKNSADIRIVVDSLDLSYQKDHIDTFVLVSGDSDFSPLVSKLRENGRYVIGMGVRQSSSDLLINNCDEFIYYEDLVRPTSVVVAEEPRLRNLPHKRAEAIRLVLETFQALQREGKEVIYGSMIKQTLIRKLPSFNETYYGYPMFSRLLEDAAENKLLKLAKDQKSGGYIVTAISEVTGQAGTATAGGGDVTQGTAHTAEVAANDNAVCAPTGPMERRDFNRYSRWGRARPGRLAERSSELSQGVRELPPPTETEASEALSNGTVAQVQENTTVAQVQETHVQGLKVPEAPPQVTPEMSASKEGGEEIVQVTGGAVDATAEASLVQAEPSDGAPPSRRRRGRSRKIATRKI